MLRANVWCMLRANACACVCLTTFEDGRSWSHCPVYVCVVVYVRREHTEGVVVALLGVTRPATSTDAAATTTDRCKKTQTTGRTSGAGSSLCECH